MSFQTNIAALATRVAQEINTLRTEMAGLGGGGGSGGGGYKSLKRTSTTTSSVNPQLIIPWDVSIKAGDDVSWNVANPTRLVADVDGEYDLGGYLQYSTTTQRGQANGQILVNGVWEGDFRGNTYVRNSGSAWDYGIVEIGDEPFELSAGDYVELALARTSGANASYSTGSTGTLTCRGQSCRVWMRRIA